MPKPGCLWVLRSAAPGVEAVLCLAPTRMFYELGDDGIKRRQYEPFCERHEALSTEWVDEEED